MSDTQKIKDMMKRKRLHTKTFKTEAMANRKCGSTDDKVSKAEAIKKAEEEIIKEIEEIVR